NGYPRAARHEGLNKPLRLMIRDLTRTNYTGVIIPNGSHAPRDPEGRRKMAANEYRSAPRGPGVPDNWFVDPIQLGVPGVRQVVDEEENPLAWQSDSLCAQTDPEA